MKANFLKTIFVCLIFSAPLISFGEILTIEKIDMQIQPLQNNEFQLFIKFNLPVLPENAHIYYAVLNMGMNVLSNADSASLVFEILSKEKTSREKIVNYNSNPVTSIISRRTKGLTELQLDITQLVNLWVKDGEKNEGIVLVSHRNIEDKYMRSDKINLATEYKAAKIKIFYTIIE